MSPSYFSMLNHALRCGFWRSVIGQKGGYQNSIEVLLGQGKLLFQYSGLSLSVPFSTLSGVHFLLQHGTISTLRSDPLLVNQRRNLSVLGALSRTFSIPSVSGPPCQVCEYHINRLSSDFTEISLGNPSKWSPMASCHSRALIGNRYIDSVASRISHLSNSTSHARVVCSNRSQGSYRKASMSLTNREPSNSHLSYYGYFVFDIMRRSCNSNPLLGPGSKELHKSSSACYSAGAAPDVFDSSAREEQLAGSAVLSDQEILSDRALKLFSGSCCIPHPDKEKTGGEDAHFICVDEQAVGVADGVGGWAEVGIDAGKYARELMSNSVTAIQEEPKGSIDPAKVLEKAHLRTKSQGSSTACIIVLREQGIHAINLGDSGFIIVRDGCTVFRSPVQQHGFNFSYQLESGDRADLPGSGQVFTIPIAPGDVIIAGTDGLFDNLYSNEITAVVVHAVRAGLEPQVTAQKIAALARQRAQDKNRQTPFSTAAQDAGFIYYGGKLDDITVVVSYISSSSSD